MAGGADVGAHSWFLGLSFSDLANKSIKAPLIPAVDGDDDTEQVSQL